MPPRKGYKKKAPVKRTMTRRKPSVPRVLIPKDGTNLLCTSYFEIAYRQTDASAGKLSYSIKIDPKGLKLKMSDNAVNTSLLPGLFANKGDNQAIIANGQDNGDIPVLRFADFAGVYNQYRINGCKISVMVDRECGLENPVAFTSSKKEDTPHADMGTIVGGAHKQYTMTESRRNANYGWTARAVEDKHFHMVSDTLDAVDAHFIKVYQEIDAKANAYCKHRCTVSLNLTMKDSSKN